MITPAQLDAMERWTPADLDALAESMEQRDPPRLMCHAEIGRVLIRLARLGLWSEAHGVPALRKYADRPLRSIISIQPGGKPRVTRKAIFVDRMQECADKALAKLPGVPK